MAKLSSPVICIVLVMLAGMACADKVLLDQPPTVRRPLFRVNPQDSYVWEILGAAAAVVYVANMVWGRSKNQSLAVAYTKELLQEGGVLDRNFAVATGELRACGPDLFKVYASGRRYCKGILLAFRMARRQDLLAQVLGSAQRDILDVEVALNEGAAHPLVLFIGTNAAAKVVPRENTDLEKLARRVEVARERLAGWPTEVLVVMVEHSSVFYDLVTPAFMELAFGPSAFAELKPYFRYLHATTDYSAGEQKAVLRISLYLPPLQDAAALHRIVSLATHLVDVMGNYRLPPEQLKRAQEARRKLEASRAASSGEPGAAERRLEERRAAKDAEERARLMKLPPDQREKERARRDRIQRQRKLKQMTRK